VAMWEFLGLLLARCGVSYVAIQESDKRNNVLYLIKMTEESSRTRVGENERPLFTHLYDPIWAVS